jgi:hypothetical protein
MRTLPEIISDMQTLSKFSHSRLVIEPAELKTMLEMVMIDVQMLAEHVRELKQFAGVK